ARCEVRSKELHMSLRHVVLIGTVTLFGTGPAAWIAPSALAQTAGKAAAAKGVPWKVSRTVDGQPDLQGVWGNNVATPLQRPPSLAGKAELTPAELEAVKAAAAELFSGGGDAAFGDSVFEAALTRAKSFTSVDGRTGDYNHFWLVEREFDNRTSLI